MATITLKGRTKSIANRSKKYLEEALYNRLFKDGGDEVTVRHQLNLFLKSRKRVHKWEVGDTIKKLRDRKHYYAALKCSGVDRPVASISAFDVNIVWLLGSNFEEFRGGNGEGRSKIRI